MSLYVLRLKHDLTQCITVIKNWIWVSFIDLYEPGNPIPTILRLVQTWLLAEDDSLMCIFVIFVWCIIISDVCSVVSYDRSPLLSWWLSIEEAPCYSLNQWWLCIMDTHSLTLTHSLSLIFSLSLSIYDINELSNYCCPQKKTISTCHP